MAWYAELKRRKWYCIKATDMIRIHKKYLYDEWYNSLTEEQKLRLEEYRKKKKEEDHRKAMEALYSMAYIFGAYNRKVPKPIQDIYKEII